MRGRDPIAALTALRAALDRIDVWVGRVARRLRCGFRHLRRIHFTPPSTPPLAAPCPAPPAADTS
ncbi:MAG: hypothetical protein R3C16_04295 [Hyphomonadaceae bacterium]